MVGRLLGNVPNLLLIELFLKRIKWLEAHTNIVETLPDFSMAWRPIRPFFA
jgi:hypothetical protein